VYVVAHVHPVLHLQAAVTTVSNKTQRPLRVPLPRGKVLHLGPGKTGQISSDAVEHPQVKALIDTGVIEILDAGPAPTARGGSGRKGQTPIFGPTSGSGSRRSGDR
jgi:hypothetical protein